MIRRALALAGAAVLVVGVSGLAGPASADNNVDVLPQGAIHLNELGVDMNVSGISGVKGEFIELRNTNAPGTTPIQLNNFKLIGCNGTRNFDIVTFGPNDEIAGDGTFLVGNAAYDNGGGPTPDRLYDPTDSPDLVQAEGGVRLLDSSSAPQHDLRWGDPHTVCDFFEASGVTPTDQESLNFDLNGDKWDLDDPTPMPA